MDMGLQFKQQKQFFFYTTCRYKNKPQTIYYQFLFALLN